MAKEPQELKWIESLLPEEGFRRKAMFGGFAYYIDEKIILITFEAGSKTNWNGCMFPVEQQWQNTALEQFPILFPHPILPKWLYLPIETEGFDEWVSDILRVALKPNSHWGSIPKPKKNAKEKEKTKKDKFVINEKIDTRRPRMFSDDAPEEILQKAKKLTDLKNIGPVFEDLLHSAGIKTPQQFFKLGWKKVMTKLVNSNPKTNHSMYAYAVIAALDNRDFGGISETQKAEARAFMKELRDKQKK